MMRRWVHRRRPSGETPAARRTRITFRCLYIDLHEEMPPAEVDLETIDHPIMRKACAMTPDYPMNQVRIQEIREDHVFRFTHGRQRVATWLDQDAGVVWVCAVDERDDDTYDHFVDLYVAGELLPREDDQFREEVEAAARFAAAVRDTVPRALETARANPDMQHVFALPGGSEFRLYVRAGDVDEIWVAMPALTAPAGLAPRMRGLVVAVIEQHLGGHAEWEQRYDWPTGQLMDYEIAYLGLR